MKRILIANRGEIANRVIRTAKKMNIEIVAVYSDADAGSPYVKNADFSVCIGGPVAADSYLRADKILDVAKEYNVDGIHPGYGFLSENAGFAKQVSEQGIKFIGPSPEAIDLMGSKLDARALASRLEVPLVPGTKDAITDVAEAKKVAEGIGYPILIKASAGGGGKGMRIVRNSEEFESQMELAQSEAQSAFGDSAVFIEKYVEKPRHIEIQVLADQHDNIVHLFERECSIQRRHQKVIEEAPSAVLTEELRERMAACAIRLTRECKYEGVGTIEFLLDANHDFYFLEMNTRLQVEHPVTEMVTGIDLVEQQILVARGEKLAFSQEDIQLKGHAIEIRVYAENSEEGFLPDIGNVSRYEIPTQDFVRVDDSLESGMDISMYYDPMIAKLAVYGDDRMHAIARTKEAIRDYKIWGVRNTLSFGTFVMDNELFQKGDFDTNFIQNHFRPERDLPKCNDEELVAVAAAVTQRKYEEDNSHIPVFEETQGWSNWRNKRTS